MEGGSSTVEVLDRVPERTSDPRPVLRPPIRPLLLAPPPTPFTSGGTRKCDRSWRRFHLGGVKEGPSDEIHTDFDPPGERGQGRPSNAPFSPCFFGRGGSTESDSILSRGFHPPYTHRDGEDRRRTQRRPKGPGSDSIIMTVCRKDTADTRRFHANVAETWLVGLPINGILPRTGTKSRTVVSRVPRDGSCGGKMTSPAPDLRSPTGICHSLSPSFGRGTGGYRAATFLQSPQEGTTRCNVK